MSDPRSGNNPLNGINPNPRIRIATMGDLWRAFVAVRGPQLRRGWNYAMANPGRRYSTVFAVVSLLTLAVIGLTGGKDTPPPQVVTAVQGLHHEVVATDDNLASIGKPYGVTRQEMIDANIDGVVAKYTTEVCPALNRPPSYFAGFLADGTTPRDGTYCKFTEYRGKNPAYIGQKLAQDSVRPGDDALVPCTEKSTPLISECRPQVVAQNVN